MKAAIFACTCLCAASLIAPIHAAPGIDPNAPITAEDLGIKKWVPMPANEKTECLIVTLRITTTEGTTELHTSQAVFDLKQVQKCSLITYRPSLFPGNNHECTVCFGKRRSPETSRVLKLHGYVEQTEGTYTPDAKTIVRYLDGGGYRVDYMVEELSREELTKIAGEQPTLRNGEKAGIAPLKDPRTILQDPAAKK